MAEYFPDRPNISIICNSSEVLWACLSGTDETVKEDQEKKKKKRNTSYYAEHRCHS